MTTLIMQELGIVELEKLYNDKYDYDTGIFGMSDKMKNKYVRFEIFYKAFSDNSEPFDPKKSKKFSDIKLREHHKKRVERTVKVANIRKNTRANLKIAIWNYTKHIKKMMDVHKIIRRNFFR